ncbi:hypothetical protein M0R89_21435 (plasmid) [Halorussus limi]|uniref:Uncharacterized protein n=1 Tax=Halorussus limi TaxID=2938695 RepID=A0A8U0I0G5_9EURY|nr:rod-determining factor RdfA [Halorussus limi]UPV76760.1 hypothetical protein M0R89_21435 [Halorussus limi]
MDSDEKTEQTSTGHRSKVARVIGEYGLNGTGDELVASWTDQGDDQRSLRELADHLNQALLRTAMEDAGMNPLDGEVENFYRLLTDDETSAGNKTEAESTLRREGIAVEELQRNFVSHQAVHTYLTEYRDAEWESETGERQRVEKTLDSVQRLQSRLTAVSEQNLQKLSNKELISVGDFDIFVDVNVFCEDCGTQRDIVDLLTERGCECEG